MTELRQKILVEAESWLGTPFEHQQRCKGAGVDCGQFLIAVYHNVGIIPNIKTEYYPRDFHLHRDREWYKELVEEFANEILDSPLPADVVLYKEGRLYSHGAIVIQWPKIIHAYVSHGVMYSNGTQGHHGPLPRKFFRPKVFVD